MFANRGHHFLSLLRRGGTTRANRPYWLIRDHHLEALFGCKPRHGIVYLLQYYILSASGIPLCERLANAQNRRNAGTERGNQTLINIRVSLMVKLAPLGVPDQHIGNAELLEHQPANLSGMRPARLRIE